MSKEAEVRAFFDAVAAAVSSTPPRPADEIPITFTRFRCGEDGGNGTTWNTTWEAWTWSRARAASTAAPGPVKHKHLPAEIGALLSGNGKKAVDVSMVSWLLLDSDKGDDFSTMQEMLDRLGMAYLIVESSTSQVEGNPIKWHLYLPLSPEVTLPSRTTPGIDWEATVDAHEKWWRSAHFHLRTVFGRLGGVRFDGATANLAQQSFVSHRPFGMRDGGDRYVRSSGGRTLDVAAALKATSTLMGSEAAVPWPPSAVMHETAGATAARNASGSAAGRLSADRVPRQGGSTEDTAGSDLRAAASESAAAAGPTPGETTGTLVYRALDCFGLVGGKHDDNSYMALCPWRDFHTSRVAAGTQDHFDDSVLVYVSGADAGEDGGFKCFHEGSGQHGECSRATAADVLRWARRRGAPIPDRPEWSTAPLPVPPEKGEAVTATSPATSFEKAPEELGVEGDDTDAYSVGEDDITDDATIASAATADDAEPGTASSIPHIPTIEVHNDIVLMAREAIAALSHHDKIFVRNNVLVDVVHDSGLDRYGMPRRPWVRATVKPYLHAILSHCARWVKTELSRKGQPIEVDSRPDKDVVAAVLAAGYYHPHIRRLEGIVYAPVFRKDLTLLDQPGYDPSSQLIYRAEDNFARMPKVSRDPSKQELAAALALLLDVLRDFPFRKGEEAVSRAVWLSMTFTRFLRFAFVGNTPMFVVSANRAGSGKGKFVDTAAIIAEGRPASKSGKVLGDEAELDRWLGMHIEAATSFLCLDNIPQGTKLASGALEALLTTSDYTTRKIGTSAKIRSTYFDGVMTATGNNLETGGDMSRRILRANIEDRSDNPASRPVHEGDLEGYCKAHRPELVHAVLTLLCGFAAARGRGWDCKPEAGGFSSFEGWSEVVRKAVIWCGLPDPVFARGKQTDDAASGFRYVVEHLLRAAPGGDLVGNVSKTLVKNRSAAKRNDDLAAFDAFLADEGVTLDGRAGDSTKLGKFFGRYNNLIHAEDGKRWQLHVTRRKSGSYVVVEEVK